MESRRSGWRRTDLSAALALLPPEIRTGIERLLTTLGLPLSDLDVVGNLSAAVEAAAVHALARTEKITVRQACEQLGIPLRTYETRLERWWRASRRKGYALCDSGGIVHLKPIRLDSQNANDGAAREAEEAA